MTSTSPPQIKNNINSHDWKAYRKIGQITIHECHKCMLKVILKYKIYYNNNEWIAVGYKTKPMPTCAEEIMRKAFE